MHFGPRLLKRITLLFLLGALAACGGSGGGNDDPGGGQPLAQNTCVLDQAKLDNCTLAP